MRNSPSSSLFLCISLGLTGLLQFPFVTAQPSPELQGRISAAIGAAANATNGTELDYTAFVNPFIGTGEFLYRILIGADIEVLLKTTSAMSGELNDMRAGTE